jgi:hypothetical protein
MNDNLSRGRNFGNFKSVELVKPVSSRPANSERYTGQGFDQVEAVVEVVAESVVEEPVVEEPVVEEPVVEEPVVTK